MSEELKRKQLLAITKEGENINVEVSKENIAELMELAKLAKERPDVRENLASLFRDIVSADAADDSAGSNSSAGDFADETGSVRLTVNNVSENSADYYNAGIELLTAALAGFAARAIESGMNDAGIIEQVLRGIAEALSNSIPSVQIKAIGGVPEMGSFPFDDMEERNGKKRLLS